MEWTAPYLPTPHEIVKKMLKIARVGPSDVVYDLGCGDGRILIAAIKDFMVARFTFECRSKFSVLSSLNSVSVAFRKS